jgi:hypothetical protein
VGLRTGLDVPTLSSNCKRHKINGAGSYSEGDSPSVSEVGLTIMP